MTPRALPLVLAIALSACDGASPDPGPDPIACGAGTMLVGTECVATPIAGCDPGMHDEGGTCVPDTARYELRIADTTLGGNGHTRRKVMAFGTAPDGTALADPIILGLDRASAGTYDATSLALGPLGAETFFTPCDAVNADCLGPATLTLALASAPADVIAHADVTIVAPGDPGTVAPCLTGGNVFYIDGDNYIRHGMMTSVDGSYYVDGTADEVTLSMTPSDIVHGTSWWIAVDSIELGTPLVPGIYDVQRFHAMTPGLAGLSVEGNGRACNTVSGRIHVYDYTMTAGEVTSFTASFEHHCDSDPGLLDGCIHYEAP